jgi:hypothetical protein
MTKDDRTQFLRERLKHLESKIQRAELDLANMIQEYNELFYELRTAETASEES